MGSSRGNIIQIEFAQMGSSAGR